MRRKNMKKTAALFLLSVGVNCMTAQDIVPVHEFDIDIQKVGSPIQSTMYGIFFEDINFGADGGLYAELIKNRSFEFENPWGGWEPFGDVSIAEKNPCFNKNPHYAHLTYTGQITRTGLENEGFKGKNWSDIELGVNSTYSKGVVLVIEKAKKETVLIAMEYRAC